MAKRQPAGPGRRSPARVACSRAGERSSEVFEIAAIVKRCVRVRREPQNPTDTPPYNPFAL